jgi:hypothetical protein
MKRRLFLLAAAMAASTYVASAKAGELFFQGFESNTDGWFSGAPYGSITQVPSGTNGITAADGSGFAIVNAAPNNTASGPYTFFNQPGGAYQGAYTASIDIYLDPSSWATGSGFDWDIAPSDGNGNYGGPDYIFHVDENQAGQVLIDTSFNSTDGPPAGDLTGDPTAAAVTTSGWYTFTSSFSDDGGVLSGILSVSNGSSTIFSSTMIGGLPPEGVDYGWFNFANVGADGLAIDDSQLSEVPLPAAASGSLALLGGLALVGGIKRARRHLA